LFVASRRVQVGSATSSLSDEVVEEELAREWEERLLCDPLVDRVLRVAPLRPRRRTPSRSTGRRRNPPADLRAGSLGHAQSPDLRDLAHDPVSCVDQPLSIRLVAGLMEPDETDVVKPAPTASLAPTPRVKTSRCLRSRHCGMPIVHEVPGSSGVASARAKCRGEAVRSDRRCRSDAARIEESNFEGPAAAVQSLTGALPVRDSNRCNTIQ
jgi:hypothetical protein